MNIFTKVTLKTMKQNPVRTMVTIIGIMISTAMFTAVTTFTISLFSFMFRTQVYEDGSWHAAWAASDYGKYQELLGDEKIDRVAAGQELGYALCGSSNDYKPYIYLEAVNAEFWELMPVHVTQGRLPESGDEILLPDHLYNNGGVEYKLGDSLTLELGQRYSLDSEGNADTDCPLSQNNPYMLEDDILMETLLTDSESTYTVVGFYERPSFEGYTAPGYTALTLTKKFDDSTCLNIYASYKNKYIDDVWKIEDMTDYNYDVIMMSGSFLYDNIAHIFTMLATVFVIIIVIGSVSMIYSAFSISVSERTRQFGLLSSIGATKKQILRLVFSEAAFVSLVGIPLGVFCGIAGIGVTLHFVGNRFNSILSSPYSVELVINGYAILIAVVIAIFTVIISAIIPAVRAVNVSAIEAIRMSKDVKVPQGRLTGRLQRRKYRLTTKLFGTPGLLARRYFSRSRKKYRVTIFSLTMSVVLFIVTSTYCDYLKQFFVINVDSESYDLAYDGCSAEEADAVKELLSGSDGVAQVTYLKDNWAAWYELVYDETDMSDSFQEFLDKYNEVYDNDENSHYNMYVNVIFIDDASYKDYLNELGITSPEYLDYVNAPGILKNAVTKVLYYEDEATGEYIRYTANGQVLSEYTKEITIAESGYYYYLGNLGNEEGAVSVEADTEEYVPKIIETYPVGTFVKNAPNICQSASPAGNIQLIFPYSSKYNQSEPEDSVSFLLKNAEGQHDEMVAAVKDVLSEAGLRTDDRYFDDTYASMKKEKNILLIINVFCYGFIILMALICVANVFNTISTNIALRRRDFAMIRSVGLSYGGVKKMMVFECLLYGMRSLVYALPISAAFSYLLYRIYGGAGEFDFYIPWLSVLIAVAGVFAMVGISMVYAVSKISSDNLIDELKNDN